MTVVAACLYERGRRRREIAFDEKVDLPTDRSKFVWIGLSDPSTEEVQILGGLYSLHPLAIEDAVKADQLAKLDVYRDQLFVVARTAEFSDDAIHYGETAIFVGHSHIISVRHGSARSHKPLRDHLETAPGLLDHGVDYVLHAIIDYIVDGYLPIVEQIEESVLTMELRTLDAFLSREEIVRIFTLRRQLTKFQRVLEPMSEMVSKHVRQDLPCIERETKPYLSDVLDHIHRVQNMVGGLLQVLTWVFEFSNLLEQQRTGAITRQLAAWAGILAVPTAIAGIYGMNFRNMPELTMENGYFVVLSVMMATCVVLYVRFRRKGWL